MPFESYGYNGVIELRKNVLDKIVLAELDARDTVISETFHDLPIIGDVYIYAKLAQPTIEFSTFVPSLPDSLNRVNLTANVKIILFRRRPSGEVERGTCDGQYVIDNLSLSIEEIQLRSQITLNGTVLEVDLANIDATQVFVSRDGSPLNDAELDKFLFQCAAGVLTAQSFKQRLLNSLKSVTIPVSAAGSDMPTIENWDLRLVSSAETGPNTTYDGIDVLLYGPGRSGRGSATAAANTIPSAVPPYSFALSINQNILSAYTDTAADTAGYYRQGYTSKSTNSATNPFGYMVFTAQDFVGGHDRYWLPAPAGSEASVTSVTLHKVDGNKAELRISRGGMPPHCKAMLSNLSDRTAVDFEPNSEGSATVSIVAESGDHLGVSIRALHDSGAYVYRPRFSVRGDRLRLDVHLFAPDVGLGFIDFEGNGWAEFRLSSDSSDTFKIATELIDSDVDGDLPDWIDVVAFLTGFFVTGVTGGLLLLSLSQMLSAIAESEAADKFGQSVGGLAEGFPLPIPGSDRVVLFLERVDLSEEGLVLSGHADAGQIIHAGRKEVTIGESDLLVGRGKASFWISCSDTTPPEVTLTLSHSTSTVNAYERFWRSVYADSLNLVFGTDPIVLAANRPILLWVRHLPHGLAKVLLEWDSDSSAIRATWIMFSLQAVEVKLVDDVHASSMCDGLFCYFSYYGFVKLTTDNFFRSAITREAGLERWLWKTNTVTDWQEFPSGIPGFSLQLITNSGNSQSDMVLVDITPGFSHDVEYVDFRFEGEDVFSDTGDKAISDLRINTPGRSSVHVLLDPPKGKVNYLYDPPDLVAPLDQVADQIYGVMTNQVGEHPWAGSASVELATALKKGVSEIDRKSAYMIAAALGIEGMDQW